MALFGTTAVVMLILLSCNIVQHRAIPGTIPAYAIAAFRKEGSTHAHRPAQETDPEPLGGRGPNRSQGSRARVGYFRRYDSARLTRACRSRQTAESPWGSAAVLGGGGGFGVARAGLA